VKYPLEIGCPLNEDCCEFASKYGDLECEKSP